MDSLLSRLSLIGAGFSDRIGYERLNSEVSGLRARFSNFKSLTDFFDVKRMSRPAGVGEAQSRIQFNLGYFSTNYAIVFAMLSIYWLVSNPILLFLLVLDIAGMAGIGLLHGEDLNLGFTSIPSSTLYTTLIVITIPLSIFANLLGTVLWLIGASGITILGHAAIMEKPIESAFAEEQV